MTVYLLAQSIEHGRCFDLQGLDEADVFLHSPVAGVVSKDRRFQSAQSMTRLLGALHICVLHGMA